MSKKGDGTFYFDKKKKLYRAMLVTPTGNRLTKSSKDEAVVKDWLNEQRLLLGRGQHIEPHGLTLGEWLTDWLEVYARPSVRARTYDRYKSLVAHAKPLYDIKLNKLLPAHLQKLYNSLEILSGSTRRKIHFCLHVALKQAVINQLIHTNPAANLKPPKAEKTEVEVFTKEELDALLKAAENFRHPLIITIAYTTGMRLSEILGLRCQDIDVNNNSISVTQTIHRSISKGNVIEEPKSKPGKRKLKVPLEVIQEIIEHKSKQGIDTGLLFLKQNKKPFDSSHYLRQIYNKVQEKSKINKNFHALRHTHATMLLAAGIPIADVSKRLGHAKISTTLDIYVHSLPSADEKIADKIADIFPINQPINSTVENDIETANAHQLHTQQPQTLLFT